jgi:hypothetical protein
MITPATLPKQENSVAAVGKETYPKTLEITVASHEVLCLLRGVTEDGLAAPPVSQCPLPTRCSKLSVQKLNLLDHLVEAGEPRGWITTNAVAGRHVAGQKDHPPGIVELGGCLIPQSTR